MTNPLVSSTIEYVMSPPIPDYLSSDLLDTDVKALFSGERTYFSFEPIVAQLVKELRLLRSKDLK